MNPPLIINGIDFNKRLDWEREVLYMRIEDRWTANDLLEVLKHANTTFMKALGRQVAIPKHPFIITGNDKQA